MQLESRLPKLGGNSLCKRENSINMAVSRIARIKGHHLRSHRDTPPTIRANHHVKKSIARSAVKKASMLKGVQVETPASRRKTDGPQYQWLGILIKTQGLLSPALVKNFESNGQ